MKKNIVLFFILLIMPSILLFAAEEGSSMPNQWDKDSKTGSSEFKVYFNLGDTNTSDLYCDIGFSRTPISNGSITAYDGNTIQAAWNRIETTSGVTSVNLTASTYAYWHVVVGSAQKIRLDITPSSKIVAVKCTFSSYEDGTKSSSIKTIDSTVKSEEPDYKTVVSFTTPGRFMGSTELTIEAVLKEYAFTDDVFCTLTMVLETT